MFEIKRELGRSRVGEDSALTLGSLVDFLQDCSIFHVDSLKNQKEYMVKNHIEIYYASRQIDIIRMPMYTENITIQTWIYESKRAYVARNTIIYDENQKACVTSFSIGAFVDTTTGKAVLMPKEFTSQIPTSPKYPMEYLERKIIFPPMKPVKAEPTPVLKFHLDFNKHVNNAKYLTIAQEYLPSEFAYNRIRVEYKTPAKYKEFVIPEIYETQNSVIVDLCSLQEDSYATVEFTGM